MRIYLYRVAFAAAAAAALWAIVALIRTKQNFPPYSFVNIWVFETKTTWVNAECRDASKNTLRTVRGSTHKKLVFLYEIFSQIGKHRKLYFAIRSGSIQSPYNLADLSKIHPIVRFWPWNTALHLADPISGGRAVKPAVQKAHNKWSVPCTFWENCGGVWRAGQKLRLILRTKDPHFLVKPLHGALIQNRRKQVKPSISQKVQGFSKKISRAACSSHRQASKTPLFGVV